MRLWGLVMQLLPKLRFYIPIEEAATPTIGEVVRNQYWSVHPEYGLVFSDDGALLPQYAESKYAARMTIELFNPDCETRKIPEVYLEHAYIAAHRMRIEQMFESGELI